MPRPLRELGSIPTGTLLLLSSRLEKGSERSCPKSLSLLLTLFFLLPLACCGVHSRRLTNQGKEEGQGKNGRREGRMSSRPKKRPKNDRIGPENK
ncbi:hypothetical protein K457DRAFT_268259 [Linnemannia elongata AG-77]|uniref:Uncharacterized protein n=1 Tax=Linnemannia elongata AG-77 TaxID=1314771 RepID=A0A197K6G4_9FUNG|nr:hypothetical protein K457DRAFT_268259 [Linnemannia elongata AG-77]